MWAWIKKQLMTTGKKGVIDFGNAQGVSGFSVETEAVVKSKSFSLFVGKDISLLFGKQKSLFLSHSENRK